MTTTSITTTAPMSSVRVETPPGIRATKTPRIPFSTAETPVDYKDCFGSELVIRGFKFGYKAWKIKGKAQDDWQSLRGALQTYLVDNKPKILERLPFGYRGHLWSPYKLDCYLVGQRQTYALPRVAVCCGEENYARAIRICIIESGLLGSGSHPYFSACFVIVAHVSQYMSTDTRATHIVGLEKDSDEESIYEDLERLEKTKTKGKRRRNTAAHTMKERRGLDKGIDRGANMEMENRIDMHIPLRRIAHTLSERPENGYPYFQKHIRARDTYEIHAAYEKDDDLSFVGGVLSLPGPIVKHATIGGLIQIGNRIFAMTVLHILREDLSTAIPPTESPEAPFVLDWDDLGLTTSECLPDPADNLGSSDFSVDPPPACFSYFWDELQKTPASLDEHTKTPAFLDSNWSCEATLAIHGIGTDPKTELDWALLRISEEYCGPRLSNNIYDANNAPFFTSSITYKDAAELVSVVLTTAHGTLVAVGASSTSSIKVPGLETFQDVWSIQCEGVLVGDCGSWAFEESTNDLVGMVIAASPALNEVYILPMKTIFQDIQEQFGETPSLLIDR